MKDEDTKISLSFCFTIVSAIIVTVSVPLYLIMLYSFHKYRHKRPFNSVFFRLSFNLGIFDLLHLFNDWVIGMLNYVGLYGFMIQHSVVFAKQFSLFWWYSAMAQKIGVFLLAIDRVMNVWFCHVSTKKSFLQLNWLISVFKLLI